MSDPMHIPARCAAYGAAFALAVLAIPAAADPTPECNAGTGADSTECGTGAQADGSRATAAGNAAVASGEAALAVGASAQASGLHASAVGTNAAATGDGAQAFGYQAQASGPFTLGAGHQAVASGQNATAVGPFSQATGMGASAFGNGAVASQMGTAAIGVRSAASAANGTALGALATASGVGATAIGVGAATLAANEVALGGTGGSVRIGDIAASTAAQSGVVAVATVDASGTLGQDTAIIPAIAALQSASGAQSTRLTALEAADIALGNRVDDLFDLREADRRDTRKGIAAAVAMGHAPMPSEPGRTSYVVNGASFRGEQAVGGALLHRLDTGSPMAIGGGFSIAGNKNNAFRLGVAGEF
jgi:trimeric autotransporter adhesin